MHSFETTIGRLRSEGFKLTPQRLSVIRYLIGNTSHPTAAVIYKDLKRKYPSLSFSTVYNTLNMLEKIGEVQSLHLFDDFLNYDPGTEAHHHFVCRSCNSIIDIFPRDAENVSLPEGDISGNRIESAQVVFKGMCRSCL
ncbi:MAG: transcriptional repressor [Candidatus Krumholzibacteria bacterium]|nr:transcriptional repressor [Candidatus Krumholzibacteria bacterium]